MLWMLLAAVAAEPVITIPKQLCRTDRNKRGEKNNCSANWKQKKEHVQTEAEKGCESAFIVSATNRTQRSLSLPDHILAFVISFSHPLKPSIVSACRYSRINTVY